MRSDEVQRPADDARQRRPVTELDVGGEPAQRVADGLRAVRDRGQPRIAAQICDLPSETIRGDTAVARTIRAGRTRPHACTRTASPTRYPAIAGSARRWRSATAKVAEQLRREADADVMAWGPSCIRAQMGPAAAGSPLRLNISEIFLDPAINPYGGFAEENMRTFITISCSATIIALSACAGLAPQLVAVVHPQDRYTDCLAVAAEVQANNQKIQELASDEGSKVGQNVAAGVAGLFIWPLWFAMDFQGTAGKEVTAIQTRQQYLGTLAEQKRCGVTSRAATAGWGRAPAPVALTSSPPVVTAAVPSV